jgi:uncharacterized membrane protein
LAIGAGVFAAGFAAFLVAALAGAFAAGFPAGLAAGAAVCPRIPGAANSVIPMSNVIKERIVVSFLLNFSLPAWHRLHSRQALRLLV